MRMLLLSLMAPDLCMAVEIKGRDIVEKVRYCAGFHEVANTNLQGVFELILKVSMVVIAATYRQLRVMGG